MEPALFLGVFSAVGLIGWLLGFKAGYSTAVRELKSKLGFRFQTRDERGF